MGTRQTLIDSFKSKFDMSHYCLTKISIREKRSISRIFFLIIVPSSFFVHCPYKGRIKRAESVLTGILLSLFLRMEKKLKFSQAINFLLTDLRIYRGEFKAHDPYNTLPSVGHYVCLGLCIQPYRYASHLVRR